MRKGNLFAELTKVRRVVTSLAGRHFLTLSCLIADLPTSCA
jgi:hypothetical protein